MHRIPAVLATLAVGCSSSGELSPRHTAGAASTPERLPAHLPGSAKVYTGPDGIVVSMVQLDDADKTPLIRIRGTTNPLNNLALPCQLDRKNAYRIRYVSRLDGRPKVLVSVEPNSGQAPTYTLRLPNEPAMGRLPLTYDEKRSAAFDPREQIALHLKQMRDGSIEAVQRFDRAAEIARQESSLTYNREKAREACGKQITFAVRWDSMSDAQLIEHPIASKCREPLVRLREHCRKWRAVREIVPRELARIECSWGNEMDLALEGRHLRWTIAAEMKEPSRFVDAFLLRQASFSGSTLARRMYDEASTLCTDGKGLLVGLRPEGQPDAFAGRWGRELFFGRGRDLRLVDSHLSRGNFFDPRFGRRNVDPSHRFSSGLSLDEKKGSCTLRCGDREVPLKLLGEAERARRLKSARFRQGLKKRRPYGLARDRRGVYYFVDRGPEEDSRDFHLFVGPTGKLKRLRMLNIVTDTEGDVFATRSGSLRLVLEKEHSFWMRRRRSRRLINVPIKDNLLLIYNELGVYLGQPYGTPCDEI